MSPLPTRISRYEDPFTPGHFLLPFTAALLACTASTAPDYDHFALSFPPNPIEVIDFQLLGQGRIAFERVEASGYGGTFVVDANASRSWLVPIGGISNPALSPDGRRIAFRSYDGDPSSWDIFAVNSEGTGLSHITRMPHYEGPPGWNPSGTRVLFWNAETHDAYSQLVSDTLDLIRLTNFASEPRELGCWRSYPIDGYVVESVQGMQAFVCSANIIVRSPQGTLATVYTPSRIGPFLWVKSPYWSPDGNRIAFIESVKDSLDSNLVEPTALAVKILDLQSSVTTTVAVVETPGVGLYWHGKDEYSLCWMPDGSRIVFNAHFGVAPGSYTGRTPTFTSHIWVVKVDGTGLTKLTSAVGAYDKNVSCSR